MVESAMKFDNKSRADNKYSEYGSEISHTDTERKKHATNRKDTIQIALHEKKIKIGYVIFNSIVEFF